MAATVHSLDTYRTKAEQVLADNPDMVLGSLAWYFITEGDTPGASVPVHVSPDQLERWFIDLGLDTAHLPPRLTRLNAFRKGSSEIEHSYEINSKQRATLRVVEIDHSTDMVLRHMLRDVVDKSSSTVSTAHVATLRFIKPGRSAKAQAQGLGNYQVKILDELIEISPENNQPTGNKYPISDHDREQIDSALAEFGKRYQVLAEFLQSQTLRATVRKVLTSCNAIMCKPSGGVYFVHNDHQATLEALKELLSRIGQGCKLVSVPLFDTGDMREELTEQLAAEIGVDCRKLMSKIAEVNDTTNNGKVPAKTYANVNALYQDIVNRVEDYAEKLGIAQARAGAELELVLTGIVDLSTRIDGRL